eukprot:CAMPEP_0201117588 /NCGR_PEP_ID=MMETSP0850-20130426/1561_1 /ASSEMBLY_ACC=CAM_ASM_000622 /TAXON_ID=183588 /ORGANISM="Pseudo-nitzschia fraudulenta, Strain WWA7" /LENGTH=116 /DNA_ID=CAMNT_0047382025 /DNA_START=89 /DNA_END=439 /DNA_ORIENTATION=+
MQSSKICLLLAAALFSSGNAFAPAPIASNNNVASSSALFGKRAKVVKKVKQIFRSDGDDSPVAAVAEVQSNFPVDGKKVKLSNGRAKDLAKKYQDIEDLGERAFEVLVDLNMVVRS